MRFLIFLAIIPTLLGQDMTVRRVGRRAAAGGPAFVNSSSPVGSANSTTLVLTPPGSIVDGNMLFAGIAMNSSATSVTPPAGWSVCSAKAASQQSVATYYKIASSEGGNYTFTFGGAQYSSGVIVQMSGAASTPDVCGTVNKGTGTTATATSITTTGTADILLYFGSTDGSGAVGIPAGWTSCGTINGGANEGIACGYTAPVSSGASGDKTATVPSPWSAVLAGIK